MGGVMRGLWRAARGRFRDQVILGAAIVATALVLSVFIPVHGAQSASATQWQVVYRGHPAGLTDVIATSKTNAWAVGTTGSGTSARPRFMHWNGRAWSDYKVRAVAGFIPVSVEASSASNVWVLGYSGPDAHPYAMVFDGGKWSGRPLPLGFDVAAAAVLGPASVWGVTSRSCVNTAGRGQCTTVLAHWNGSSWSAAEVPGKVMSAAAAVGRVFFLAVKDTRFGSGYNIGHPVIYEFAGDARRTHTFSDSSLQVTDEAASLAAGPDGERYVLARLTTGTHPVRLFHEVGAKWSVSGVPANACPSGPDDSCPPAIAYATDGFWSGASARYTGGRWANARYFGTSFGHLCGWNIQAVAPIPGTASAWGVGDMHCGRSPATALVAVNGRLP